MNEVSKVPEHTLITALHECVASVIKELKLIEETVGKPHSCRVDISTQIARSTFNGALAFNYLNGGIYPKLRDDQDWTRYRSVYNSEVMMYAPAIVLRHRAVVEAVRAFIGEATLIFNDGRSLDQLLQPIDEFKSVYEGTTFQVEADAHPTTSDYPACHPQLRLALHQVRPDTNNDRTYNRVTFDCNTPLWQVRERQRVRAGIYTALPDEVMQLLPEGAKALFPHLAVKPGNVGLIAYTQSPTAGVLDRQQVIKPGRFIRQYCPDLTDEQVKQAAAAVAGALTAGIHHSCKEEDYAHVFINGPSSCMGGKAEDKFDRLYVNGEFYHPARIYAHPDNALEIVWVEVNGRIAARAVINTQRKEYPRIYSTDSVAGAGKRLSLYLDTLGYSQRDDALVDQKLLKVSPDCDSYAIICPYIDSGNQGVSIHDDHLVIDGSGYEANHETGCLCSFDVGDHEPDWYCEHCDAGMSDDDDQNETVDGAICHSCANDASHARYISTNHYRNGTWYHTFDETFECALSGDTVFFDGRGMTGNGYVTLDEEYYSYDTVAPLDYCVSTEDGYVLTNEMGDHRLFYNGDEGMATPIADWIVLDGELVRAEDADDAGMVSITAPRNTEYPMLPHFETLSEEDAA